MRKPNAPRLRGYDYTEPGTYFITVCTHRRLRLFGEIQSYEMHLSPVGEVVQACWEQVPAHFPHVELDEFTVMPDHFHALLHLHARTMRCRGEACLAPTPHGARDSGTLAPGALSVIVGAFKAAASSRIHRLDHPPTGKIWQRSFYDRIVRDPYALDEYRVYIASNPLRWAERVIAER